ncbi:transcription factor IBH1-like protein [Cinnamomum micranthum f. kanehirae]|uniref:Transcription factor IBH1-like protein n=1 Tax=Cinnamomum micranthum f. kanehirae TaxID=337451 RepID=A0A3S3N9R9_9MAGN|nr:transcription factor IBH1-like protein [Cinnamomum micranthum f. kanehirae]
MQASNSFKRTFLKKFLVGIQQTNLASKNTSLFERRNAIKLSSDIALASARDGANWSRAIVANASKQEKNKNLVKNILGEVQLDRFTKLQNKGSSLTCKRETCKRILRRSRLERRIRKRSPKRVAGSAVAKRIMKKRSHFLKCVVPGGELMDEFSFIDETIDYIFSLRAQVDVMQRLANAFEHCIGK